MLIFFLAGCTHSMLTVHTQPPGGVVKIQGLNATLQDGDSIKLKSGNYTLRSFKQGYSGGSIKINVSGQKDQVVTVPLGEPFALITLKTIPSGLRAKIVELKRTIRDGDTIPLQRGQYTFVLKMPGYKEVKSIVPVDGHTPQTVILQRGEGYGQVCIKAHPAKALIQLDDLPAVHGRFEQEINAGKHLLKVSATGYFPFEKFLNLEPGKRIDLKVELKKIPDSAYVTVLTKPEGGSIYFQGKKIGTTRADLGSLKFGTYVVKAIKQLDEFHRVTGNKRFKLSSSNSKQVILSLTQREYFFQGNWMPESQARSLEEQSYTREKVANPLLIDVHLSKKAIDELLANKGFAFQLHHVLRVGDCIKFHVAGKEYMVWKRHRDISPEFEYQVQIMQGKKTGVDFLFKPAKLKALHLNIKHHVLSELAFFIYKSITDYPLLNLDGALLNKRGENIYRCVSDGAVIIILQGGKDVRLNKKQVVYLTKDLYIQKITPENNVLSFSWQSPPQRILVVSDKKAPFMTSLPANIVLKRNEKKLLRLVDKTIKVKNIVRITCFPDNSVKTDILKSEEPFEIDLSIDEAGPHDLAGHYKRIWIVRFVKNSELSQRQVNLSYQVINKIRKGASEMFFRRKK